MVSGRSERVLSEIAESLCSELGVVYAGFDHHSAGTQTGVLQTGSLNSAFEQRV